MRTLLRLSALLTLLSIPVAASAELWIFCGNLPGCPSRFVEYFTSALIALLILVPFYVQGFGVLFIMVGGAYILLSAGREDMVTKGKGTITWAVIGIFLANFAQTFVGFLQSEVATRTPGSDLVESIGNTLIGDIFTLLYVATAGVAIFCGMRMVLAFGKEDQFKRAVDGLFYAALGAIIINLSQTFFAAVNTL
jgi:hypothetical protein